MAITFEANEYLTQSSNFPFSAYPCTFACWVNVVSFSGGAQWIYLQQGPSAGTGLIGAVADVTNGYYTGLAGGGEFLCGGGGSIIAAGRWQHYCTVYDTNTSRWAFVDGGNKATSAVNMALPAPSLFGIVAGSSTPAGNNASYAEFGAWNVALTDAEVKALSRGVAPTLIRPKNLVLYYPFDARTASYLINRVNGVTTLAATGTPIINVNHAPTMPPYDFSRSFSPAVVTVTLDVLRPNADTSDGTWTNESGNQTNLFASIDETTADDDTTYIRSTVAPVGDVCKIALENPAGGVTTPMRIRYRYRKSANSTAINLQVRLLQGTTEVWSTTHNNITESYVTADTSITPSPAITDPNDLHIEFTATMA